MAHFRHAKILYLFLIANFAVCVYVCVCTKLIKFRINNLYFLRHVFILAPFIVAKAFVNFFPVAIVVVSLYLYICKPFFAIAVVILRSLPRTKIT